MPPVRFDDSLKTVLAADASPGFGAQAAFRQLADLVARGRVPWDDIIAERLTTLRADVPATVRGGLARALAHGSPATPLVAFFAADEPAVAAEMLRGVILCEDAWIDLLPGLGPSGRAVLRGRRDLPPRVARALESFGATDFVLPYAPSAEPAAAEPIRVPAPETGPFMPVGAVADHLPIVIEARRRLGEAPEPIATTGGFPIADLVDRIEAFRRNRPHEPLATHPPDVPVTAFRFDTDASGAIRTADAAPRGAIVGVSLVASDDARSGCDGAAGGAFRRRAPFTDARMTIGGGSALAGEWRISGVPRFDPASGRFTGYRGAARRPRRDESAARPAPAAPEGLRRLMHELRTPTNAISGFAELIESELLGPVAPAYRAHAATIRAHAADLVTAIEDLDLAARIESDALALRTEPVALDPLLARVVADLAPLAALRGAGITISAASDMTLDVDERTADRLLGRLLSALLSAAQPDERLAVDITRGARSAEIAVTRPRALATLPEADLLTLDAEREADRPGAPLLGVGFALRLARNLASELGGAMTIGDDRVRVRLPATVDEAGLATTR